LVSSSGASPDGGAQVRGALRAAAARDRGDRLAPVLAAVRAAAAWHPGAADGPASPVAAAARALCPPDLFDASDRAALDAAAGGGLPPPPPPRGAAP